MRKRGGYPITSSPLYKAASRSKLAKLLGISNGDLRSLQAGDSLYTERDIPKANGNGFRHIENPCRTLKLVQARLAKLFMRVAPPEFLFCPVKGRSYVDNAARHVGARTVRCLDIKAFFPSVPSRRVFWFYYSVLKCTRDVAGLLTRLTTYQGHLPTGSPLSPIMSYFAYCDMWAEVAEFCAQRQLSLSVYIDDCTISGDAVTDADVWKVKRAIYGRGLRYHKEKTYRCGVAEVTGAILRDGRIMLPNRQLRKLKDATRQIQISRAAPSEHLLNLARGLKAQATQFAKVQAAQITSASAPT